MKHTIFTLFSAALLLTSCGKSAKETTITGQVRTFGTQEAIRHDPVYVRILEEVRIDGPFGNFGYQEVSGVWADQNNNFSVTAKLRNDGTKYCLAVDPETVKRAQGYYKPTFGNIDRPERLITKVGGTHNMNYYLTALGWVKFHFINTNNNDRFSYSVGGGGYEQFFNPSFEIIRKWDFGGNIEHTIYLGKTKNGVDSVWNEAIFVPAFDTLIYEIKY